MAEKDSLKIEQRVNKAVFDPGSSASSSGAEDTVADSHLNRLDALLNPTGAELASTTGGDGPTITEFEIAGGAAPDSAALSDVTYAPGSSASQLADIDAKFSGFDNAGPSEAAARLAEVNESFAGSDSAAADETPASPEDNWA